MKRKAMISVIMVSAIMTAGIFLMDKEADGLAFDREIQENPHNRTITEETSGWAFGETANDRGGFYVKGAGDLNGDGMDDVSVASPFARVDGYTAGKVYIIFGNGGGVSEGHNLSNCSTSFHGTEPIGYFGYSIAGDMDMNGDGYIDIAISAPYCNDGENYRVGAVYVFFGRSEIWQENTSASEADVTITGNVPYGYIGMQLSSAGDINGDGYDELLISSQKDEAYLVMGKETGWDSAISTSSVDTKFHSSTNFDLFGCAIGGGGDVNGDGYDDIVISAERDSEFQDYSGQVFLFLGKESGFGSSVLKTTADASFYGEGASNMTGRKLAIGGDVNGDGFGDILISCTLFGVNGQGNGKVYLILGGVDKWERGMPLWDCDGSWFGEDAGDYLGYSIGFLDDHNSDGLDDIIFGAPYYTYEQQQRGKVYLVFGTLNGFETNKSAMRSDRSYIGSNYSEPIGNPVSDAGDLNGDGSSDIVIGSSLSSINGYMSGVVYFITSLTNYEPLEIHSIATYSDEGYSVDIDHLERGDRFYIEVRGEDGNTTHVDTTKVNITYSWNPTKKMQVAVRETGVNTGIYRGMATVPLTARYPSHINLISVNDGSFSDQVSVHTPIIIGPEHFKFNVEENGGYVQKLENHGYSDDIEWEVNTDAPWISFDEDTSVIRGTPSNLHVGDWEVDITLSCAEGVSLKKEYTITVINIPPVISTDDILTGSQDIHYYNDYDCDQDGIGEITWHLATNASWLNFDEATGELSGTPDHSNIGLFGISVWVDDGNGGDDRHDFDLLIEDVNDKPVIVTEDKTDIKQGFYYEVDYSVTDLDDNDLHLWTMETTASWLSLNEETGVLSGMPGPDDVGNHLVKLVVTDSRGKTDEREFVIIVQNVNDPPELEKFDEYYTVDHGQKFEITASAEDPDDDKLKYSIETDPLTEMTIDEESGEIQWDATIRAFSIPPYRLRVVVSVFDGEYTERRSFFINICPSEAPVVNLDLPSNGLKILSQGNKLEWTGSDPEGDEIEYSVYLSDKKAFVQGTKEECLLASGLTENHLDIDGLEQGITYFWTVIPTDGCSIGQCESNVWSFTINGAPELAEIEMKTMKVGEKLRIYLEASDPDEDDNVDLIYSLIESPEGMSIDEVSGTIYWTPGKDQAVVHKVVVGVTDGMETTKRSFMVDVISDEEPGASSGGSLLIIIGGVSALAILTGIAGIFLFMKKRKEEQASADAVDDDPFGKEEEKEMAEPTSSKYCNVTISANEAHIKDQSPHRDLSYEDLYGKKEEKVDEKGMTKEELKDYIGDTIKELEKI